MLSMNAASGTGKPTGTMFPFGNNIVPPSSAYPPDLRTVAGNGRVSYPRRFSLDKMPCRPEPAIPQARAPCGSRKDVTNNYPDGDSLQ
jgi:hypothetical protein